MKTAVLNYLKEDNSLIFVIDHDSYRSMAQRRRETNSLINQIERVTRDRSLNNRVSIVLAVQELEAWLLVDCLGIFCYFADKRGGLKKNCRKRTNQSRSFGRLVRRHQKGDTTQIVEAEIGGRGPKEYLEDFTEEVLRELNPRLSQRDVRKGRFSEKMSPEIAEYVVINSETIGRNSSLRKLGELLSRVT